VQSKHGPAVPLAGGGGVDPEQAADLLVRQPLEVPQEDDLPVCLRQLLHGLAQLVGEFPSVNAWLGVAPRATSCWASCSELPSGKASSRWTSRREAPA